MRKDVTYFLHCSKSQIEHSPLFASDIEQYKRFIANFIQYQLVIANFIQYQLVMRKIELIHRVLGIPKFLRRKVPSDLTCTWGPKIRKKYENFSQWGTLFSM